MFIILHSTNKWTDKPCSSDENNKMKSFYMHLNIAISQKNKPTSVFIRKY